MAVDGALWLGALRGYLLASAIGHLVWESLQIPLYTIWREGTAGQITFAIAHCTAGDLIIAIATLVGAVLVFGRGWPRDRARFRLVAAATIFAGVAYTFFSEWLNVSVRGSWTYSSWMPLLPPLGTGLSPVLQWIVVPALAFYWVKGRAARPF